MKNIKLLGISILAMLIITGCAHRDFTWDDAESVKIGDTGKQIIEKMKNKPYNIVTSKEGDKVIEKYIYVSVNSFTGASKSVSFILTDGKTTSIPSVTDGIREQ